MRLVLTALCLCGVAFAEFNVTINGYTYWISYPLKLDWFQAFRHCRYINMHLIDLTTHDEINQTAKVINFFKLHNPETESNKQLTNFWTSGCDHGEMTNFYWMSNGHSFTATNWAESQPDHFLRLERCVEMQHLYPFKWNDEFCDYKKNFICRDRVVGPVEQLHQMNHDSGAISARNDNRPTIPDSEKPVMRANASFGYTHVSLI